MPADGSHAASPAAQDGLAVRRAARAGRLADHTSSLAPGFVQDNLAILPAALAGDILRFCQREPKPCPVLRISEPGSPHIPELGRDLDLRRDIPRYRVWADLSRPDQGEAVEVMPDEIPLSWACGVTPQAVIAAAQPDFAITHAPVCMLVTDLRNSALAVL